jgi:hypothetical protein
MIPTVYCGWNETIAGTSAIDRVPQPALREFVVLHLDRDRRVDPDDVRVCSGPLHAGVERTGTQPRAREVGFRFFARPRRGLVGRSALLGSPPFPRMARVVSRTPRSASLTAASEGKASATSGSSRTRLLPSFRSRAAYFPRTPPFMEAKSYSGRRSSWSGGLALLIECSLAPRRSPGADDADCIVTFGVRYDEEPSARRRSNRQDTRFRRRVALVREGR